MPLDLTMSVMSGAEFLLWAVLAVLFWSKKQQGRFPALGAYLALRLVSTPILLAVLYIQAQPWGRDLYFVYFFGFWAVYIASSILLFFICVEIFRATLASFAGLLKFGLVIFRWVALASVIVSCSTISFAHLGPGLIPGMAYAMMRSVSILELCLLAFLCLSMNALQLSARDLAFGVAVGFGVLSANDLVQSLLTTIYTSLSDPLQVVSEAVILAGMAVWVVYFALPAPARQPVVIPANSTIYRWNEIASALGYTGTQVAVQQSANSFFLSDVEKVVDKVLTRSLKGNESGS